MPKDRTFQIHKYPIFPAPQFLMRRRCSQSGQGRGVAPVDSSEICQGDSRVWVECQLEVSGRKGIWVGEDSTIPNTRGIRNDVVAALRTMKIPVLRWPGGCFADEYH